MAFIGFKEQIMVLHDFSIFLKHSDRLIEGHRHGNFGQVFADRIFQNFPDGNFLIWIFLRRQLISKLWLKLRKLRQNLALTLVKVVFDGDETFFEKADKLI